MAERGVESEETDSKWRGKKKRGEKAERGVESEETDSKWRGKKKRGEKEKEKEKEEIDSKLKDSSSSSMDPLMVLGPDLVTKILKLLEARSVARLLVLSLGWYRVAVSDRIWGPKCEELWMGKAHIPRLSMVRGASRLAAYSLCVMDGKRTRITREDLCDHVWEFRFQESVPEYWLNIDPSWKRTGAPMRRYFHPDGSQTADPDDPVWGGHECSFSVITSYVCEGKIREHYVRINRWPPMKVSRKDDWSWEMSNDLYRYNSIPDADKKGGTGPLFPVW